MNPPISTSKSATLATRSDRCRRTITELTHEYHRLTAAELKVDELGDPLAPDTVLTSVRDSLTDLKNTLTMAEDCFDVVQRYSSRLKPA